MKLSEIKEGQCFFIKDINTDDITIKKLQLMGIESGKKMRVAKESFGSVLVVFGGKMVALGNQLTNKVIVDACDICW